MDEEGGFARTVGGLGMPWYPVRAFGDFSLKMQWRDSSVAGAGNSGVFVRFPDPRIPLADRPTTGPGDWDGQYCGRIGSAATQPAWVAIYCGQEIQINDHQGDTQKTGSIYNFEPVEDPDHMGQPKGTWVDYEIRVEGQQYTILRNGQVLNEFDNSIPQDSSRGGDPPTHARQFSSGYIGLQNHGGPDVIDFRNVSVLPLDDGTVEGPIVIDGAGATVEFRSTDAAGNVEETQEITVGDAGEADLQTRVAPRRETVKLGKKAKFDFTVRNRGDVAAQDVELCVKAPKSKVRILGNDCRETPTLGKGQLGRRCVPAEAEALRGGRPDPAAVRRHGGQRRAGERDGDAEGQEEEEGASLSGIGFDDHAISRRNFLHGVGGAALICSLEGPSRLLSRAGSTSAGKRAQARKRLAPFEQDLPIPPVAEPVSTAGGVDAYEITMRPGSMQILEGEPTEVLGYDGIFPGPTIRARRGRPVTVLQRNQLANGEDAVVHLHGGINAPEFDGHPDDRDPAGRRVHLPVRKPAARGDPLVPRAWPRLHRAAASTRAGPACTSSRTTTTRSSTCPRASTTCR